MKERSGADRAKGRMVGDGAEVLQAPRAGRAVGDVRQGEEAGGGEIQGATK